MNIFYREILDELQKGTLELEDYIYIDYDYDGGMIDYCYDDVLVKEILDEIDDKVDRDIFYQSFKKIIESPNVEKIKIYDFIKKCENNEIFSAKELCDDIDGDKKTIYKVCADRGSFNLENKDKTLSLFINNHYGDGDFQVEIISDFKYKPSDYYDEFYLHCDDEFSILDYDCYDVREKFDGNRLFVTSEIDYYKIYVEKSIRYVDPEDYYPEDDLYGEIIDGFDEEIPKLVIVPIKKEDFYKSINDEYLCISSLNKDFEIYTKLKEDFFISVKGEFDIKYKKYNKKITKKHDVSEVFIGSFKKNKKEKEKIELSTKYLIENY